MRRTTGLIAAAIIAVIVVALTAYLVGKGAGSSSAGPSSPGPTPAASSDVSANPTATSSDTLGAAPTGCLGGPARNDAMVLSVQRRAPHTAYGAVEVAAAVFRWAIRSPEPSADDVHGVAGIFSATKRDSAQQQLIADYSANPNPSGGAVPDGQSFYLTTANGQWLIASGGTADRVSVNIEASFVIEGAVSPTKSLTEAFNMVWEDGAWHLDGLGKGDSQRLAAGGTQFTGGC